MAVNNEPSNFSRFLIGADKVLSHIPVVSTFVNFVNLVFKRALTAVYGEQTKPSSHYFRHLMAKDTTFTAKLLVPGMNIYVATHVSPYQQGKYFEKMGNLREAIEAYEHGVEHRDPDACYELACYYKKIVDVATDIKTDIKEVRQAISDAIDWLCKALDFGKETLDEPWVEFLKKNIDSIKEWDTSADVFEKMSKILGAESPEGLALQKKAEAKRGADALALCEKHKYEGDWKWIKDRATKGDKFAQYYLGTLRERTLTERIPWLLKAAQQNLPEAQYELGMAWLKSNVKEALDWLEKAAKSDHQVAMFQLGAYLINNGDEEEQKKGEEILRSLARDESKEAKYCLGKYLLSKKGKSFEKEGVELLQSAAREGLGDAQYEYGKYLIRRGKKEEGTDILLGCIHGTFYDLEDGYKISEKSTWKQEAEVELAILCKDWDKIKDFVFKTSSPEARYAYGKHLIEWPNSKEEVARYNTIYPNNIPKKIPVTYFELGLKYLEEAASSNHIEACYEAAMAINRRVRGNMSPRYLETAAKAGHTMAQYEYGKYLLLYEWDNPQRWEDHQINEQKVKEAVKFLTEAAKAGCKEAQYELGRRYLNGQGVTENKEEAVKLLQSSVDQGFAPAQYQLAKCHFYGDGVKKDENKFYELLEKAATNGDSEALTTLGYDYIFNKNEKEKGERLLKQAAEKGSLRAQYELGKVLLEDPARQQEGLKMLIELEKVSRGNPINPDLCYRLGEYYNKTKSTQKDAFDHFCVAGRLGHIPACEKVIQLYRAGKENEKNAKDSLAEWTRELEKLKKKPSATLDQWPF